MRSTCFDDSSDRCASTQFSCNESLSLEEASDSIGTLVSLAATTSMTPITPCDLSKSRVPLCPHTPLATEGLTTGASNDHALMCRSDRPKRKRSVHFVDNELSTIEPAASNGTAPTAWPLLTPGALTPGALLRKGLVVRGTFLDVAPTLPTPVRSG